MSAAARVLGSIWSMMHKPGSPPARVTFAALTSVAGRRLCEACQTNTAYLECWSDAEAGGQEAHSSQFICVPCAFARIMRAGEWVARYAAQS